MGALIIIVPIVIYYYLIKWLFNKYYKDTNKTKRKIYFILLVTLPFWDHIAGYAYYKYLCFSKGGITIYKTVTDLQEQRDYWFYDNPAIGTEYHQKDKLYKYLDNNGLVKRNGKCLKLIKKENYYICAKGKKEIVYLNYCNNKYNNLPTTHKNYKNSCKYTDTIIKKYNLKNVIKVPRSPYGFYISTFDKNYNHKISKIFYISLNFDKLFSRKTNEILAIQKHYSYGGGWYINVARKYGLNIKGSGCPKEIGTKELQETIIPNPYKQNNKTTKGK